MLLWFILSVGNTGLVEVDSKVVTVVVSVVCVVNVEIALVQVETVVDCCYCLS